MAVETRRASFAKAVITEEDGEFIITEIDKEEDRVYNLSEILREWTNVDGIKLTISKDKSITPVE